MKLSRHVNFHLDWVILMTILHKNIHFFSSSAKHTFEVNNVYFHNIV
jgi:hypothetical protein